MNPNHILHLCPHEAAARLRVSVGTLANWRSRGPLNGHIPPRYMKFGGKVLYPVTELEAYEARCLRAHSADNGNR